MSDPEGRLTDLFNQLLEERALADDLAAVLDAMDVDLLDLAEVKRVLARYREARRL